MKRATIGLLWGVLFLFSAAAQADTHIPGGFVSGIWTPAGSPYILDGNIVVHQDSALTIQSGVDVLMDPFRRFRIEGQILALGTQQDSIRFIATDTTEGSEGLDFLNTNLSPRDSSKLVYCDISYGVASPSPDPYMHGGGLYIKNSSRLLVSHCLISHCRTRDVTGADGANGGTGENGGPGESVAAGHGGAIYIQNSNPALYDNTLSYDHTGEGDGGEGGDGGSEFVYGGGTAEGGDGGNAGSGTGGNGGAICLINSMAVLYGNMIHDNRTGDGYGGAGGAGGSAFSPEGWAYGGNGVVGAEGRGGHGGAIYAEFSHASISNNLIYANRTGDGLGGAGGNGGAAGSQYWYSNGATGPGGIGYGGSGFALYAAVNSFDDLYSCTVSQQNYLSQGQGGAGGTIPGGGSAAPGQGYPGSSVVNSTGITITNCILWNNASPTINTNATVNYTCVQNGHAGIGNFALDPFFVSAPMENFCLAQIAAGQTLQSACVNAGNPGSSMIPGTTRTDGVQDSGIVDMGYHYPLNTPQPLVSLTLTPHNPPIQIPPGGGSFQFDVEITYNDLFPYVIDFWTSLTLPDGNAMPIFSRNNVTLPPGGVVSRPNLTQYIPGGAMPGSYIYNAYIRDHFTWESLAADSFAFVISPTLTEPIDLLRFTTLGPQRTYFV